MSGNGNGNDVDVDEFLPSAAGGKLIRVEILGKKILELIQHAVRQMKIRGVTEDEVIRTVRQPQVRGLPTQGNRYRVRRQRGLKRGVDVVYEILPDRIRVITVIVKTLP